MESLFDNDNDYYKVFKEVLKAPDIREDKVKEIKKRIKEGTYTIDIMKIADKILTNI